MNYIGVVVFKGRTYAKSLLNYDEMYEAKNDLETFYRLETGYKDFWYWGEGGEPNGSYIMAELMTPGRFYNLYGGDPELREDLLYKGFFLD